MTRYYANGKIVREELDTNFDQKPDVWKYYEDEKLVRQERDTNGDGKVDEWEYYEGGKLDRIGYDTTGNGTVNKWDRAPENDEESAGGGSAAAPAAPAAPAAAAPTAPPPAATTPPPAKPAAAATTPPRGQGCARPRHRPPAQEVAPLAVDARLAPRGAYGASRSRAICRLVAPLRVRSAADLSATPEARPVGAGALRVATARVGGARVRAEARCSERRRRGQRESQARPIVAAEDPPRATGDTPTFAAGSAAQRRAGGPGRAEG